MKRIALLLVTFGALLLLPHVTQAQKKIFPIESQDEIAWVQETLTLMGYECGPVDGIMGPSTRSCIRSLQKENGLEETGSTNEETYKRMIELLYPVSEEKALAESDEQADGDPPESQQQPGEQPDPTESPRAQAGEKSESEEADRDRKSDDQPVSTSQTQEAQESQSRSNFEVRPYVGYNNAAGYTVDFNKAFEIEYDPAEDDGSEIASTRGGLVLGVGANIALSERESFGLRLRPSVEMTLVSDKSEDVELVQSVSDFTLKSSQQYFQFSGDVVAQFNRNTSFAPYAGVGVTYVRFSGEVTYQEVPEEVSGFPEVPEEGETVSLLIDEEWSVEGTALGVNVLGGVRFNDVVDFGVPFAQLKVAFVDPRKDRLTDLEAPSLSPTFTVTGGVSFGF